MVRPLLGPDDCSFDTVGSGNSMMGDFPTEFWCADEGAPPISLVEFIIGGRLDGMAEDFYVVSLVGGYNMGLIQPSFGGSGDFQYVHAGCQRELGEWKIRVK
ncbi:pathogenesis-related thaumatin superfamily protein [Striga asiatica]|uniref:Pathogenesis-related thaumatin superfamily protein n=1 Tax=Striga asiatica TaxID=4170 RepID=A0A5A7NX82_STRAF|nr:pathogenesis-related thaumatin superfamily protein [Striga asiatica]